MNGQRHQRGFEEVIGTPIDFASLDADVANGRYEADMISIYGHAGYEELRKLAQEIRDRRSKPPTTQKPTVLIIPGTMSTQLAKKSGQIVWIDPVHLLFDWELLALSLEGTNLIPCGVLPFMDIYYFRLILFLQWHGYSVDYVPYDWRLDFEERAFHLRNYLERNYFAASDRLFPRVNIITHSEGGLVVRGALSGLGDRAYEFIDKLVLCGSPNYGTWSMIQMFQGQFYHAFEHILPYYHKVIVELLEHQRLSRTPEYLAKMITRDANSDLACLIQEIRESIDKSIEEFAHPFLEEMFKWTDRFPLRALEAYLTKKIISTWPAWYQMLPFNLTRLYDASQWPLHFPRPHQRLLERAEQVQRTYAMPPRPGEPGYGTWHLLMGTGIETLTCVQLRRQKFQYEYSRDGDGIVSLNLSKMDNTFIRTFKGVNHSDMMSDEDVVKTIIHIFEGQ